MSEFLSREEINDYWVDQLSLDEQTKYNEFGDMALIRVFIGKLFVVYTLIHGSTIPEIITNLRVTSVNIVEGDVTLTFLDLKTGDSCKISYLPELLCGYDIFAAVPSDCLISKVLKKNRDNSTFDAGLSAGVLLRHRMKPEFLRFGYVYCIGLSDFQRLFGNVAREAFEKLEENYG